MGEGGASEISSALLVLFFVNIRCCPNNIYMYIYICIYIYIYKQDGCNMNAITKTMYTPSYQHDVQFIMYIICPSMHELAGSRCGDNWQGTLFS